MSLYGSDVAGSVSVSANMAAFMDLNVTFCTDKQKLRALVETAAHLGFSTVAINYVFEPAGKKKAEIPSPQLVSELFDKLPIVQGCSRPIRVLSRLTIVMTDHSHYRPNATEYKWFDLLSVYPTTEKLFHAACMNFDVDIICISVTERLPFFFKRAPVFGAIERGVFFEVSYSAAIRDATMRRYTIANAVNLVESCKGKNVIVSSAAERALDLRGPYDIANLSLLFGLSDSDSRASISSCCRSAVLHAETRKTASGVIYTMKIEKKQEPLSKDGEAPAAKRTKCQATN